MEEHYDFIIIGSGAGGGTLALHLAPTGKKILILERGEFLPREKENWDPKEVFVNNRYTANEEWLDKDEKPFQPGIHYYVGGNTKLYGAALLRKRKEDFGVVEHRDGTSPAWPITYDEMEPYYTQAEKLFHVHGEAHVDPTEPPRSTPFPYPPLKHEPRIEKLYNNLQKIGLKPFPLPIGARMATDDSLPKAPRILSRFDGFPDLTETKADAHVVAIEPALKYPNVTLKTGSYVKKLETDSSGRKITSVVVQDSEGEKRYSAYTVVLSAGAVNSAALLLRSANDKHPNGLANSSDVVGRHYMCHNNSALVAVSLEENPTQFGKTLGINDFYFGSEESKFPLGHIQMLGKSDKEMFRADAPSLTPGLVLDEIARHGLDFWLTTEDLPDPNNRVTLKGDGSIQLTYNENNTESHRLLTEKLKKILTQIGCKHFLMDCSLYLGKKIPIAGVAHQCGTIKFGTDPKSSALDIHCKAHDLDNLYVVDGSFFVSSSSVNPGLTIIANALRVGDHLKAQS